MLVLELMFVGNAACQRFNTLRVRIHSFYPLVLSIFIAKAAVAESAAAACPIVKQEEKQAAYELEAKRASPQRQKRSKRMQACNVSLGTALPLWNRGKAMIVDVRPESEYAKHHIPGSINTPLLSLAGKSFLKTKSLILVNNGHSYSTMESACSLLKEKGFKHVKVLNGGLLEWVEHGHPITGNPSVAASKLRRISTKNFYAEYMKRAWRVIDLTQKNRDELKELLPRAEVMSLSESLTALQKGADSTKRGTGPDPHLLAVTVSGNAYDNLAQPLIENKVHGLFYLEGGLEALRAYRKKHAAMLKRLERGPVKYTKCSLL